MLQLQDQINSQVNPDWKSAGQDWPTAVFVETAEMIESYGYKWWKKQTPDMDNVRLELVDIWHFFMSGIIEDAHLNNELTKLPPNIFESMSAPQQEDVGELTFQYLSNFMSSCFTNQKYGVACACFAQLCDRAELSWEQLYSIYIAKNALNAFRANNGYKEGTYKKIWLTDNIDGDKEDNYFLMEHIKTLDITKTEDLYEEVYNYLTAAYHTVQ